MATAKSTTSEVLSPVEARQGRSGRRRPSPPPPCRRPAGRRNRPIPWHWTARSGCPDRRRGVPGSRPRRTGRSRCRPPARSSPRWSARRWRPHRTGQQRDRAQAGGHRDQGREAIRTSAARTVERHHEHDQRGQQAASAPEVSKIALTNAHPCRAPAATPAARAGAIASATAASGAGRARSRPVEGDHGEADPPVGRRCRRRTDRPRRRRAPRGDPGDRGVDGRPVALSRSPAGAANTAMALPPAATRTAPRAAPSPARSGCRGRRSRRPTSHRRCPPGR